MSLPASIEYGPEAVRAAYARLAAAQADAAALVAPAERHLRGRIDERAYRESRLRQIDQQIARLERAATAAAGTEAEERLAADLVAARREREDRAVRLDAAIKIERAARAKLEPLRARADELADRLIALAEGAAA